MIKNMVIIINKEEIWKVLYSNLNHLRLNAVSFDSDKLFDFAKELLLKLIQIENKGFVQDLKFIDALLGEPVLNLAEVFGEIDEMIRKYGDDK